jgi:hypothetical protein
MRQTDRTQLERVTGAVSCTRAVSPWDPSGPRRLEYRETCLTVEKWEDAVIVSSPRWSW